MRTNKNRPFLTLDLPSDTVAQGVAEALSERTGRTIRVTNEAGEEVHEAAPPRGDTLIVRPKTAN